ncbi:acyltransferase family protein [Gordonia rubripertincta]|uniref:Acyltransferase family protein n=1 Tax=Gordonia rubripertincta TaxID=36822 RepID=A0ABT4MYK3_GORRU|nr:acyltransferase family protein [Gordonia rubripertincta]MCZ4551800.1 acyltransferase family protein [Gordonia rubripertincta]
MATIAERASDQMHEKRSKTSSTRRDLQGMRAVAVLAVVIDHLFEWPGGGFVGVDVFFVLSGFFITGLLVRERSTTRSLSFQKFYTRRVRRIIPSATLVLAATVVASYILLPAIRAKETLIDALWAAVFASNWRFERVGTDYFQEGQPPSPLQHFWSLSIEEQFYFVWPILMVGLFAASRRYSRPGFTTARQLTLATAMGAICLISFGWAIFQSADAPTAAYFSTFTRVWELGVGALLAICAPTLSRIPDSIRPLLSYIGLLGVVLSFFMITTSSQFPGPWAALPVLSTALVIAAFQGGNVRAVPHLTNPVAQYIGNVSYTLYLWHWPVIVLLAAVVAEGTAFNVIAILVTIILTCATFHLFEDPIRRSSWLEKPDYRNRRNKRIPKLMPGTWGAIGLTAAVVVAGSALVIEHQDQISNSSQANQQLIVTDPQQIEETPKCFGAAAMLTDGCPARNPANDLTPSIDNFADDTQGAYSCYRKAGEPLRSCTYGYEANDGKRLAIVGDSHAAMLLPALSPYLIENKLSLTTYVGNGCQWQVRTDGNCYSEVMPEIQEALLREKYDLVIATGSRKYGGETVDDAVDAYLAAWRPVAATGTKILVVADNPSVSEESLACLTRVSIGGDNSGKCGSPRQDSLADQDPLPVAADLLPEARLLDLTDAYCTPEWCPTVVGDVIAYRDTAGHITATFAQTLSPQLIAGIRAALG